MTYKRRPIIALPIEDLIGLAVVLATIGFLLGYYLGHQNASASLVTPKPGIAGRIA